MGKRKDLLVNGSYYHIFSRSIASYKIFNNNEEFQRLVNILDVYRYANFDYKYSRFIELEATTQSAIVNKLNKDNSVLVEIVAYCVMPTHIHLILKQLQDNGISFYLRRVLNSYSKYFNVKHKRIGPLWASRFKSVSISTDEQLLHLTRYVHLNPCSAGIVDNPEDWLFSSYLEYIDDTVQYKICSYNNILHFSPKDYKKFNLDRKSYQKELSSLKKILFDHYTG